MIFPAIEILPRRLRISAQAFRICAALDAHIKLADNWRFGTHAETD
ncbi:hypothetical protein [Nisaea sp.]